MDQVKKLITNIPKPFKNKYLLTLILFSLWIVFIDDYNLIRQYQLQQDIEKLKEQKSYYLSEIKKDSTELKLLENDKEEQERFAREKFLMKRENEDVFIIREKYNE